ncbi:MAG: metallophosphoesterase family protein, partial [Deltaproteobacteria bacterium]|nr:metallophosphoesterase family protein [Deltaproteobacteria bacterium]
MQHMSVRLFLSHPIFTKVSTSAASTLVFLLALPVLNAGCPQTAKITATPAQVHLGLERAPATTMVITWRSATPHGEVRYSAEKHPQQRQAAQSTAYAGGYLHHAYLTGLVPNTRYRYRCGHGAHLSASYRFMTAPAPSAATPLRIVALGDSRSNDRVHRRIIRAVLGEKPRIVLHTGDMVQTGDRQDQWDRFFTIAEPLAARVATLSAIGNHERNDGRYYTQLVLPTHGAWPARAYAPEAFYALDYGFLHLIVLSTEPVGPPTGPQTR